MPTLPISVINNPPIIDTRKFPILDAYLKKHNLTALDLIDNAAAIGMDDMQIFRYLQRSSIPDSDQRELVAKIEKGIVKAKK